MDLNYTFMKKGSHSLMLSSILWLTILTLPILGWTQQDPMFTQFQYNNDVFFNPASAGRGDVWRGALMHRAQWVALEGAPTTSVFVMEGPIQKERAGLGLALFHDRIGANNHTGIYGSYAYRFPLSEGSFLSLGIRAGATHFGNDFSRIVTPDGALGDPVYDQEGRVWVPRFGGGIFWNTKRAYIGLAIPAFAAIVNQSGFIFEEDQAFLSRHYFISGGYVFDLGESDIQLKPFAFMRYHPAAPLQMDIALQAWFKNWFSIGASYRWGDSIGAMMEIPVADVFSLTYAYDYTTSAFRHYGQGAHEIALAYRFLPKQKAIPSIHKFPTMRKF